MNISIPDVFHAVNTMNLYGDVFRPKAFYGGMIGQGHGRASDCIACGLCEGVCPQHLPIIALLKEASAKPDTQSSSQNRYLPFSTIRDMPSRMTSV